MADCMYFVAEGVVRIVDPDSGRWADGGATAPLAGGLGGGCECAVALLYLTRLASEKGAPMGRMRRTFPPRVPSAPMAAWRSASQVPSACPCRLLTTMTRGGYFGEFALLQVRCRQAGRRGRIGGRGPRNRGVLRAGLLCLGRILLLEPGRGSVSYNLAWPWNSAANGGCFLPSPPSPPSLPRLQGERGTRTASAEAATMCLLFSLSRRTFYRIAAHYPEVADSLNIVAAARTAVNSNQSVNAEELLRIKVCAAGPQAGAALQRGLPMLVVASSIMCSRSPTEQRAGGSRHCSCCAKRLTAGACWHTFH